MRIRSWYAFPLLLAVLVVPLWFEVGRARGGPGDDDSLYVRRRHPGRCLCDEGQSSWEYLRPPMRPPNDPPVCGLLASNGDCGSRGKPKGVSSLCWSSGKEECFWKRHAWAWKIKCSQCLEESECEACDEAISKPDEKALEIIRRQLKVEGHDVRKHKLWIAITPHFYVVTNIDRKLKVITKGGAPRIASGHEVAHLFAERCERAYEDYVHWFKGRVQQGGKMAVYLMSKTSTAEEYSSRYFGNPRTEMLYGGSHDGKVAGGYAFNGFVGTLQESREDQTLHSYCRHMIGHILFSCWTKVAPFEKECPKWAFIGAAHFMEKLLPGHEDMATYCSDETTAPSGPGDDWMKRAEQMAYKKIPPIGTFFNKNSLADFDHKDHIRAWSLMYLGLTEDKDRWLSALAHLRNGNEEGYAFQELFALSPDGYHDRWVERLTGKRTTMGEIRRDSEPEDEPGKVERTKIATEQDPDILAGLVRGLHEIKDLKMLETVVGRLDHPSDLVREAIVLVLARSREDEILEWLRTAGLTHSGKLARAGVARVLGTMRDALARPALEAMLKDSFWLARANAASALAVIKHVDSFAPLVAALGDSQPKAWMAVADAVRTYDTRSKEATLATIDGLSHSAWQVRVTACQALSIYGTQECMDALIKRYEQEQGRIEREVLAALRAVSGDDLGKNPRIWKEWWDAQKAKHGGFDPMNPPAKPTDDRYAPPEPPKEGDNHYYGRPIYSRGVGFVFDTSGSMDKTIVIAPGAVKGLGDIPQSGTRMQIAKEVLAGAIKKLDPRTHFTLVFFSSNVRPWKDRMIVASAGNVNSAVGAIMNAPPLGETNIHGALKAAMGLHDKPSLEASLEDIPDTVYFLTDGSPTEGEITAPPELLGWFRDINRFAKVQMHVVAFGSIGVDIPFLRALADSGGGDFIHVPEE